MPSYSYNNNSGNNTEETLTPQQETRIKNLLRQTLYFGLLPALAVVIGYALTVSGHPLKFLFIAILIAGASYISGFFLGFLLGLPKRNEDKTKFTPYNLSNSLSDIADWFTKIVIGLGLVEIKQIPHALLSIGNFIQQQTETEKSVIVFSVCTIIYFFLFGLYYGYNYMRLYLIGRYKITDADAQSLPEEEQSQLYAEVTKGNMEDSLSPKFVPEKKGGEIITASRLLYAKTIDRPLVEKINEFDNSLKNVNEKEYTFETWYLKGIAAYNDKGYSDTITFMNNALALDKNHPSAADAYMYIGLAYFYQNNFTKAIEATETLIRSYPNYDAIARAHLNNSIYYSDAGNYDRALIQINAAESELPNSEDILVQKQFVLQQLNRPEESLSVYDKLLTVNQQNPSYWYGKAMVYAKLDNKESMFICLGNAIKYLPSNKLYAKKDEAFKAFWNDEDFKKLVA